MLYIPWNQSLHNSHCSMNPEIPRRHMQYFTSPVSFTLFFRFSTRSSCIATISCSSAPWKCILQVLELFITYMHVHTCTHTHRARYSFFNCQNLSHTCMFPHTEWQHYYTVYFRQKILNKHNLLLWNPLCAQRMKCPLQFILQTDLITQYTETPI